MENNKELQNEINEYNQKIIRLEQRKSNFSENKMFDRIEIVEIERIISDYKERITRLTNRINGISNVKININALRQMEYVNSKKYDED